MVEVERPHAAHALALRNDAQYHELPGRDYVAVRELLTAAGAVIEQRFLDVADGPLAAWLEERITD